MSPAQITPNCASPSTTMTNTRVSLRPQVSDSQPTTARPMPLMTAMMPMEDAATSGPKPTSLAKSTWKEIPKIDTPAVMTSVIHIRGSTPVLMASLGVYCFTAGGFLARAAEVLLLPPYVSGSMSAGHQFFGGSLKKNAQDSTTIIT